jgi:hypothetical protein
LAATVAIPVSAAVVAVCAQAVGPVRVSERPSSDADQCLVRPNERAILGPIRLRLEPDIPLGVERRTIQLRGVPRNSFQLLANYLASINNNSPTNCADFPTVSLRLGQVAVLSASADTLKGTYEKVKKSFHSSSSSMIGDDMFDASQSSSACWNVFGVQECCL